MSGEETQQADDLVAVAKIVRTRGLRGELVADLLTDFPERFGGLDHVIGVSAGGERLALELENHWFHEERLIVKIAGYDSIDEAKKLVGFELAVPEDERVILEDDEYYDWELEGCRVETVEGESIGVVSSIMRTGGVELLVVDTGDKVDEKLIPLAEEICVEIDIEKKLIRIDPPDGLLEF
jgi:16S rRNA processing protein RimM